MATTWVGYNLITDIEAITQLDDGQGGGGGGKFTTTSKPFTIDTVTQLNLNIYNYINAALRTKGITVPIVDLTDISTLSLVNTYLAAEVIENTRWKTLENTSQSPVATRWGNMGRELLNKFVMGKSFFSDNTVQGAYAGMLGLVDKSIASEDSIFTLDYKW